MKKEENQSNKKSKVKLNRELRINKITSIFTPIILGIIALAYKQYWLLILDLIIIFLILYLLFGFYIAKQIGSALYVYCDPYKYYRYLIFLRKYFFFVRINKSYYKVERAIGLRNQGEFDKAKTILLSIDVEKFETAEQLVVYYNNLCDLLTLLKNYAEAQEALEKGFIALKNLTDVNLYDIWYDNLIVNQKYLQMSSSGNTIDCEEIFRKHLEKAEKEYPLIESHYNLAEYYYFSYQYEKALEHFDYIIQKGNKLFHVKRALEYKEKIENINI